MQIEAGGNSPRGSDRSDRLLGTPSCSIPVGGLSEESIEILKERQRKALEKYGYLSNRES